ncbi:MAG TPA: hypothetical protein VGM84_21895 [Steroidobacteraceae bacterium]
MTFAAASAASVLFVFTNGRTNLVAISLTSWPIAANRRAQCCELLQAAIATINGVRLLKFSSSSDRCGLQSPQLASLWIDRGQLKDPVCDIETGDGWHDDAPANVATPTTFNHKTGRLPYHLR